MLLGERKCQESLKLDLIRRIKMLEYALKQERAKYHRLKFGTDPPYINDAKFPVDESGFPINDEIVTESDIPFNAVSNSTWRQSRQILRQYLAEVGYTDSIIDIRSNRIKNLLGMNNIETEEDLNLNGNDKTTLKTEEGLYILVFVKPLFHMFHCFIRF